MMRRRQFSLLPAALLSTPAFASLDDSLQRLQQQWRPRLAWRADPSWRAEAWPVPGVTSFNLATMARASTLRCWPRRRAPAASSPIYFDCASRRASMRRPLPAPRRPGPHPAVLLLHDHGAL